MFAVKVFHQSSHQRSADVQIREFDLLRKLNHDNVVQLLAIEEEQASKSKVIVMEFCNGGSLYSILEEPESAYGLKEKEFRTFLEHTAAGMKHLRDQRIVHRDIKPGNIMKLITCDGSSVYKLTDFGAARELMTDEEGFTSLYGTEEYLHPDLYERAVLRRPFGKKFDATVDLWSIGVTIYHVATGSLPFRPYGGRKNKETMYKILSEKEHDVISGVQEREGGDIVYSKELPPTCMLSQGLKDVVLPMLAGLLETHPERSWSFDDFFDEVMRLKEKLIFNVFDSCHCRLLKVYVDKHAHMADLLSLVEKQTAIKPDEQLLIIDNADLRQVVSDHQEVLTYPRTSSADPIYLFISSENVPQTMDGHSIPKFPKFGATFNVETDYALAKSCTGLLHYIRRKVDRYLLMQTHINKSVVLYESFLMQGVASVWKICQLIVLVTSEVKQRCRGLSLASQQRSSLPTASDELSSTDVSSLLTKLAELDLRSQELSGKAADLLRYANDYNEKLVVKKELSAKWKKLYSCTEEDRCSTKVALLTQNVGETFQQFKIDRRAKALGYNEEQIHKFEKNKMNENCTKAKSLVEDHCFANTKRTYQHYLQWYKMSYKIHLKFSRLEDSKDDYQRQCSVLSDELTKWQEKFWSRPPERQPLVMGRTAANGTAAPIGSRVMLSIKELSNGLDDMLKGAAEISQLVKKNCFDIESCAHEIESFEHP